MVGSNNKPESGQSIRTIGEDEIAESVKVIMKALKEYFGLRLDPSQRERLRVIGSEFGHMASRHIPSSDSVAKTLDEVRVFWTSHGLGEMELANEQPLTVTIRNCYDCIAAQAGETLCSFEEGFINTILSEKLAGLGRVEEIECCGTGAERCKFAVTGFTT